MRGGTFIKIALIAAMLALASPALAETTILNTPVPITLDAPEGGSEVNIIVYPPPSTTTAPSKGTETPDYVTRALDITDSAESYMEMVLTIVGIFVALCSIIVAVLIGIGWFDRKKNIEKIAGLQKQLEGHVDTAEGQVADLEKCREKAHAIIGDLLNTPFNEEFDNEKKARIDKASRITEAVEELGGKLGAEDYFNMAAYHYMKHNYETSLKHLNKALSLKPSDYNMLFNKGVTLGKLKRFKEAVDIYNEILDKTPNDCDSLSNKAFFLNKTGKPNDAIDACKKALANNNKHIKAIVNLGVSLSKLSRYKEALAEFEKALELDSNDYIAHYNKGNALSNLGMQKEAIESYDEAISLNSNYANSFFNRSCVYSMLGERTQALSDLRRAIELDETYRADARKDEDFKSLHGDPEFRELVELDKAGDSGAETPS